MDRRAFLRSAGAVALAGLGGTTGFAVGAVPEEKVDVRVHLIVRNSRFAAGLDIIFENFRGAVRNEAFKLRNPHCRRGPRQRARRSASDRMVGTRAADSAPCRSCL
jgi:hypothetical protein